MVLDKQVAESVAYLGLDLVVLLLLLLLILLLLLLMLLISLVTITNHLLELSHDIGRDLLKKQTSGVDVGLVARTHSVLICQSFRETATSWVNVTRVSIIIGRRADIRKSRILRLSYRESCFV